MARSDGQDAVEDEAPESESQEEREQEPGMEILHVFGRQLKCLRVRMGMERAELAARTGYSASTIASFEQGRRIPPPRFIDLADEAVDAGGALKAMKEEMERAQYPAFFRDAAGFESRAVELHAYDAHGLKGLLQTQEYAQAVFRMWRPLLDEAIVEERVTARMARQVIFDRRPTPNLSFVIEEAVLHKRIGGNVLWRGQLEHLMLISQKRYVELQVMPLDQAVHAGLAGPFTLMEVNDGRRIAYAEVQSNSRLFTERNRVRELESTYGVLRAQAMTPQDSLGLIEKLLGAK